MTTRNLSVLLMSLMVSLPAFAHYYDAETGLDNSVNRDYDAKTGRFIESDPIGLEGGSFSTYTYVNGNPINAIDPLGLDVLVITGGMRDNSMNVFGHVGTAVTGSGVYSYGNDTPLASSAANYINSQRQYRNQLITVIPTSRAQDAAMIRYFAQHPDNNDVGKLDNCAVRTNEALMSAGVPVQGIPFPGGTARDVAGLPGAKNYFIPQGTPIPSALQSVLQSFEPRLPK